MLSTPVPDAAAFILSPSEQIHECVQLPASPVVVGATPQKFMHKQLYYVETCLEKMKFVYNSSVNGDHVMKCHTSV